MPEPGRRGQGASRRDPRADRACCGRWRDKHEIAAEVGVHVDTVRKWRRRFVAGGLPGLDDLPRSGRRRAFTAIQVAEVKALACTLPAETGQPLSRWSRPTWPRGDHPRYSPDDLAGHRAPMAGRRCDQALAAPVLDLSP